MQRIAILGCALSIPLLAQIARHDQGPVDPAFKIGYITLILKPSASQQAALERLLEEQQDRSSANYHRWLTPEQFGDRFGLSRSNYSTIVAWIEAQGFQIENRARARNWVAFSGTAGQIQRAFHTEIHLYVVDNETHYGNATELRIPEVLRNLVSGVRGLDDFWNKPSRVFPQFTTPAGVNQLAPDDWATIYNVLPLYGIGIDGTGQRVAIVGRSAFNRAFLDSFRQIFALGTGNLEVHLVGPDPGITNAAGEAALDVEWAGAIARNATVVYVYANNFNDAAQAAVDQNLAPVMSESFGICEPQSAPGYRSIAQQANAQGITWLASSGDSGGADCDPHGFFGASGNSTSAVSGPAVSMPASFPEVTAVGGTQFNEAGGRYWSSSNNSHGGSAISYIPEVVWNETGVGGLLASGGGASIYFPKPAWQVAPGVPADNARDVPDISFSAAGNHDPYMVVNANGQRATGGTSASSPAFAGVVALLNQYVVSQGMQAAPGLGNINPQLYRLARINPGIFHDIVQGNNMVPCVALSPGCSNGTIGFNAAPGYDLATGLGSIDVYKLVTGWNAATVGSSTTLSVNPGSITLGDSVQLTATVTSATGTPTGTVTFSTGRTILGIATLVNSGGVAMATLTVTGPRVPVGSTSIIATYGGDSGFNGSSGSAVVRVTARSPGSGVVVSITPNPAHGGQAVKVSLTEENGVGTTITGWTINGVDNTFRFATDFGSNTLQALGTLSASFSTAAGLGIGATRLYVFTGVDADGRKWTGQYTLTLVGPLSLPGMMLSSAPATVQQNPAADPSCQWSQQLLLQEKTGLEVQLTKLLAGGVDWTGRMQQLFGTTRLAALGSLQAQVCWAGSSPPASSVDFEIDGVDQTGDPVTATVTASFVGAASNPGTFSVSKNSVALTGSSPIAIDTIELNFTGSGQAWTVSVFPSNQATAWLLANPSSGTGSQSVNVGASSFGLSNGVYNATLVFQATNTIPQVIEVPVVFTVGATSSAMSIGGVTNGASFQQAAAPGMILSVFGTGLAPSPQAAGSLPLPQSMAGVSATVNGITAPLYYVSPGQLNIQIPYQAGAGAAVLGVNNNGQLASFIFTVSPTAPGIFADAARALVPTSNGKPGDILILFVTGEGEVTPPLATGASPFFATPLGLLPQPGLPLGVTVGGVAATVVFAGIPPGLAGVTQVNFVIPNGVPPGVQPLLVTVGGVRSVAANLTVTP
ncbi:MAG TPA: protease pro-enzyme activation domain-containing protein [Bryobacteraceae bacterium]|nr:protease pro-enzyme activation domain-containing protein [Bryobacteraceae bacterium]